MIYRNSQKWVLAVDGKAELAAFKKKYPQIVDENGNVVGTLRVKFKQGYVRKVEVMNDKNGRTKNGFVFPSKAQKLKYVVTDENGTPTSWTWCKTEMPYDKALGQFNVKADIVELTEGTPLLMPRDLELAWFLDSFCPILETGERKVRSVKTSMYFEDKQKEADMKVRKGKAVALASAAIYDMKRIDLEILYANVWGVAPDENLTDSQVMDKLISALESPVLSEKVMNSVQGGKSNIEAVLTAAIEAGAIEGNEDGTFLVTGGKKSLLCAIAFTDADWKPRMIEYLDKNKSAFNRIEKATKVTA